MTLYKVEFTSATAQKVVVTGTFDDWSQSKELVKVDTESGDLWSAEIECDLASIDFKFVVDSNVWTTDSIRYKVKVDENGNENNTLSAPADPCKEGTTPLVCALMQQYQKDLDPSQVIVPVKVEAPSAAVPAVQVVEKAQTLVDNVTTEAPESPADLTLKAPVKQKKSFFRKITSLFKKRSVVA